MSTCFDPWDSRCKSPFGAVPAFSPVDFAFYPESTAVVGCTLFVYAEFSDRWSEVKLLPAQDENGAAVFSGTLVAPPCGELLWYHFSLCWQDGGACCYDTTGYTAWDRVKPWQLTVYDARRKTPEWFGQGITYQIFPDRFCRVGSCDISSMVGERRLHTHWDEPVEYRPDEHGNYCSDFFGGNFAGILQKLPYLASLHVTTLYFNPIFEAGSNHRYDTADYESIDPMLGTEEDFRSLCLAAKQYGMRVMLDGVFNHTGRRSRYFNADGFYQQPGAVQGEISPYYSWFRFSRFPDQYDCWWGIRDLPAVNKNDPSYQQFIALGENAIVRRYLRCGADAWRLDVADELPDELIVHIRQAVQQEKPDALLLGEVWEDGSNKISYGKRRKYLLGAELHGLMNYPLRSAILAYLTGGDAAVFFRTMETLRENYPPAAFYSSMNFLSTHDTPRILTLLGCRQSPDTLQERAAYRLSEQERLCGTALLRLAALLLYCFPGSPTLFYGDEVGMQGFEDPFNRGTFPWGREDSSLIAYFRLLGSLRSSLVPLQRGSISYPFALGRILAIRRSFQGEDCICVLNASEQSFQLTLPFLSAVAVDALTGRSFYPVHGALPLSLGSYEGLLLVSQEAQP